MPKATGGISGHTKAAAAGGGGGATGAGSVEGGAHRGGEDWVWTPVPSEPRRGASGMQMSAVPEVTP